MVDYEEEIRIGTGLKKLAQLGIQMAHLAPNVLQILFEELAAQSQKPVFFAIDGAQNLFKPSDYVDGSFRKIDSFAFNVARLFLNFARGTQKWVNESLFLSAPNTLALACRII
jgi:small subunit ribosomal protein S29